MVDPSFNPGILCGRCYGVLDRGNGAGLIDRRACSCPPSVRRTWSKEELRDLFAEFIANSQRDTVPVPPACDTCYMAACVCFVLPDETGGEGGP